jgi:hypothetical protein
MTYTLALLLAALLAKGRRPAGRPVPLHNSPQVLWPAVWPDAPIGPGSGIVAFRLLYLIIYLIAIRVFGWLVLLGRSQVQGRGDHGAPS